MTLRPVVLAIALVAAGCGGDDATDTTAAGGAPNCVASASDIMAPVGLNVALGAPDVRVQDGQLVASEQTSGIWFLSAELDGPGLEKDGDVATWATKNRYGADAIYSVDELAKKYTSFRTVEEAGGIARDDPAAAQSRDCVTG